MKIESASTFLLIVGLCLIFVVDVEAGWKFWKSKDKETTTTTIPTPTTASPETLKTTPSTLTITTNKPSKSPPNIASAVIGVADPGLAVGVTSTAGKIKENARPSRPNPGTDVGLDFPVPKPGKPGTGDKSGQGYREWAADLTGAGGSGGQPPKLPSAGPALTSGAPRVVSISTPSPKLPASTQAPTGTTSTTTKQVVVPELPKVTPNRPGTGNNHVSSLHVGTLKPNSPTVAPSRTESSASSGLPGKSWAEIAGGGSGPNTPTSPPKHTYPSQPAQPRPQTISQPSKSGLPATTIVENTPAGAATASTKTYSSNPTYSKGNSITDEDLEKLSEALFIKDNNNANKHISINLQKQTSSSGTSDDAPQPLFTVNSQAYQGPTIQKVISIYDNYKPETNVNEHISPLQRQEESLLVDTFLSTNVMSAAMRFLADKGQIRKDYYEYKDTLRKLWFNLFSRGQGKIGSSGFEHVFMGELKNAPTGTEVVGLHNWIYYSKEESTGKADYCGYLKKVDLGDKASILKIRTKYSGYNKPVTTIFVGTSPELEMALYTICFYARPDATCPVSLGGTRFNIVTHKFKYRGNDLVGTAYPDI